MKTICKLVVITLVGLNISCGEGGFSSNQKISSALRSSVIPANTENNEVISEIVNPVMELIVVEEVVTAEEPLTVDEIENIEEVKTVEETNEEVVVAERTTILTNPEEVRETRLFRDHVGRVHKICDKTLEEGINDTDGDGFGFQSGESCIDPDNNPFLDGVIVDEPSVIQVGIFRDHLGRVHKFCDKSLAEGINDTDGDGYGYQSGESCIDPDNNPFVTSENVNEVIEEEVVEEEAVVEEVSANGTFTDNSGRVHKLCDKSLAGGINDADGDGFGFQSGESCIDPDNNPFLTGETTPNEVLPDTTQPSNGQLLFSASSGQSRKQNQSTSACINKDPSNPTSVNYNSLYYFGDYLLNSNPWNGSIATSNYSQCILEGSMPGFNFDWGGRSEFASWAKVWDVRAFPEVLYGVKRGGNNGEFGEYSHGSSVRETKEKTGLPVQVNKIPEIIIDMDYTAHNTGDYNVSIESFFHSSCDSIVTDHARSNMKYEIMLWLDKGEFNPAGSDGYVGDTVIDGLPLEVWTKNENNLHYLTYVVKESHRPVTKKKINWTKFIDFAKQEGHKLLTSTKISNRPTDTHGGYNRRNLNDNYCLANILIGTEIWNGQGSFKLNKYEIKQYAR